MAEGSDLEKTEPASPRRLEQAREEGDIPRSRELATCTMLLAAGFGLWLSGESLIRNLNQMLSSGLSFTRERAFDPHVLFTHIAASLVDVVIAFIPLAIILTITALATPMLIGGWMFSAKALQPKFGRLNPLSGMGRMVSSHAAMELAKAIGKTILVGSIAWIAVTGQLESMLMLSVEPIQTGGVHLANLLWVSFISIVCGLVIIAAIDAPYQIWHYANKLKMSREEVRQESKESDGDPQIKARIRSMQREMARRRMMSQVPTADVVVTNPTHFAVALKYTDGTMRAPKVVAKGTDEVAAKIRELAAEHKVPLLEAPPLARALYKHTELGDEIPEALYTVVAEVLAYVFQLRTYGKFGGMRPQEPQIMVPPQLDPLNPVAQAAATTGAAR